MGEKSTKSLTEINDDLRAALEKSTEQLKEMTGELTKTSAVLNAVVEQRNAATNQLAVTTAELNLIRQEVQNLKMAAAERMKPADSK